MIRRFYPSVREVLIYWECVAALEEAEGDLKSAVDCYERAIIQGASVCLNNEFLALQLRKYLQYQKYKKIMFLVEFKPKSSNKVLKRLILMTFLVHLCHK
jgi:hypothetical protein